MGKYGEAAISAVHLLAKNEAMPPRLAWETAVQDVFPSSESSRSKGCPRDAFLALCGLGAVRNVAAGIYTRSIKNRGYVERALAAIRFDPGLATNKEELWSIATGGEQKKENAQMDVLVTLYLNGRIK
ncbi:hypothetical protein [Hoeflea sp. BAL378]|uniref:DUF6979 family protein n=1 Tax=Hoeflea sp. BAL378 TaxID=1547437 RepID=UPI001269C841|nr:hypothetical protein [Hoeflea sp. BAL378]